MTGLQDSNIPQDFANREFHRERLSAMVDGMLSTDEARFLLRRMEHDDELADCWQRWQLYGDAMRGQAGRALPADFAQRVGRAIADDQAVGQTNVASGRGSARHPFLLWGGGGALAATVAFAALLAPRWMTPQEAAQPNVATAVTPTVMMPLPILVPPPTGSVDVAPQAATAAAVLAAASVAQPRVQKRHIMAGSRAQVVDAPLSATVTGIASSAESSAHAPIALANVRQGEQPRGSTKPWPSALVPGAPQSGSVADYQARAVPVSPFHPGFERPSSEVQPQAPAGAVPP